MAFERLFVFAVGVLSCCSTEGSSDQLKFALACVKGDLSEVTRLVTTGNIDLNTVNGSVGPCLVNSSYGGYNDLSRFLLEKRADVNIRDEKGGTPLVYAVIGNKPETVQLLLEYGADPSIVVPNENGIITDITALKIARARGNQQIIAILEKAVVNGKGKS